MPLYNTEGTSCVLLFSDAKSRTPLIKTENKRVWVQMENVGGETIGSTTTIGSSDGNEGTAMSTATAMVRLV